MLTPHTLRMCTIVAVAAIAWLHNLPVAASAADDLTRTSPPGQTTFWPPDVQRPLADLTSFRSRLEQAGLQFKFTYYGDGLANTRGGVSQGLGYAGRFGTIIDADLEKLVGWSGGAFHASIQQIHGTDFSATRLQNLAPVSGVEALSSTRLFNLWIEQTIGSQLKLRLGQFTAAQEFLVSDTAVIFVNSTFGWPLLPAQVLPSGSPSYPEATPGALLTWAPNDQLTLQVAVFNGDPAGPGPGNPVQRDPYGLAFRVSDPPLLIAEIAYDYNEAKTSVRENPNQEGGEASRRSSGAAPAAPDGQPGTVTLGAWLHAGQFADQRLDNMGRLLAATGGTPLQHSGNFGVYGIIDQLLWRAAGNNGQGELRAFLRAVAAPSDRNLIDRYFDAGLTYKGPFDSRPDDTIGLAIAYGRVSPWASQYDRDVIGITGSPMPIRDHEAIVELTYKIKLAPNRWLQPTVQYIAHPSGHVSDPLDPKGALAIRDALVIGLRTQLRF